MGNLMFLRSTYLVWLSFSPFVVCSLDKVIMMSSPSSNDLIPPRVVDSPLPCEALYIRKQTVATLCLLYDQRKLPATGRKPVIIARLLAPHVRFTSTPLTEPPQHQRATNPTLLTITNDSGNPQSQQVNPTTFLRN